MLAGMLLASFFVLTILTLQTLAFSDHECPENYLVCGNGKCVSNIWVCDGVNECGNWADEKECDTRKLPNCRTTEFECENGGCIPTRWRCDGEHDCEDGSDEIKCNNSTCDGFQCDDHRCLPGRWKCDDEKDCDNGEDEELCHQSSSNLCDSDEFSCSSGSCLSTDKVCNGIKDCSDGSDEGEHCGEKCTNTSCDQVCKPTPSGISCSCNDGFELAPDNKTCSDINECKQDGFCSQKCKNTVGSFECSCLDGYKLQNRSCIAYGAEPLLMFSTFKEIRGLYLRSEEYFPVHNALVRSTAIDVDPTQSRVYWTELSAQSALYSAGVDGRGFKTIISNGLISPEDLAIDYIAGNVYITDSGLKKVIVCRIDGSFCATLHKTNVYKPRSLALDLAEGLLYWSDWGEKQSIQRSNLDGTRRTVLVSTDVDWPNGIVIDHTSNRLYWCDAQLNRIEYITLDGKIRKTILQEEEFHPFSITVFEDTLYYSDWKSYSLKSCNKFTGHQQKTITRESGRRIMGVHVYHPVLAKKAANPCWMSTCSHICVIGQFGKHRCLCPAGFALMADQKTCLMDSQSEQIFISDKSEIYHMQYEGVGQEVINNMQIKNLENVADIAYNCKDKLLYVSDMKKNEIVEVNLSTMRNRDLVTKYMKGADSLHYDWLGKNLYWTDATKGTVEVYSTLTRNRNVLLSNLSRPIALALVPEKGIMFLSEVGNETPRVDMYDMDGKNRKAMPYVSGATVSLALHPTKPLLFWSDQHTRTISSLDYLNPDRSKKVLKREVPRVTSIAVGENFLYWMELSNHKVNLLSLHSNTSNVHFLRIPGNNSIISIGKIIFASPFNGKSSACQINNGGCSHVCLVNPTGHSCACPEEMKLSADKKTCTSKKECEESDFKCHSNGLCLPQDFKCDDIPNCDDGSDEKDCEMDKCPTGEFQCANGHCISNNWKCDSRNDCDDGSDEEDCPEIKCSKNKFACGNGQCVPDLWRCDGEKDCTNGRDEENCKKNKCDDTRMRCKNGQCVPAVWMCDGTNDCKDNSDESEDRCGVTAVPCLSDDFRCDNGDCIDHKLLCNHRQDCQDNSDEKNCVYNDTCKKEMFKCNDGTCIYQREICDGHLDCDNDETHNCSKITCSTTEFYCSSPSKRCIPQAWLCDGHNDCDDGADEQLIRCPKMQITTMRNLKIPCDEFTCKSKQCLPWSKVCNEVPDCSDYSDEGGSCFSSCMKSNGGCSHLCTPTPSGPNCTCPSGYELLRDGKACEDIDECSILGSCSQFCINTRGGFKCSCADGYFLTYDHRKCKADGGVPSLVYLLPDQIRGLELHTHTQRVYVSQEHTDMRGFDYDSEEDLFFWSDWKEGTVNQYNIVTKNTMVMMKNLNRPYFIKWDWIAKNMFLSTGDGSITACSENGDFCADVMKSTFRHISSIEISPISKYLFWSVWSDARKTGLGIIERSNMDGTGRIRIVSDRTYWPSSLAVDNVLNSIYWTDVKTNVIEATDFHGRNRRVVVNDGISFPFSMTIFEDYVYWANWGTDQFFRSSKFFPSDKVLVHLGDVKSESITIVHKARQPKSDNPCQNQCHQLCLPKQNGYSCLCDKKFELRNETCILKSALYTRPATFKAPALKTTESPKEHKLEVTSLPTKLAVLAHCEDNFCLNGGECYMIGADSRCTCPSNYYGMHCELGQSNETYDYSWVVAVFLGLASIALIVMVILVCLQNRNKLTKLSDTLAVTFRNPPKVFRKKSGLMLDIDDGTGADEQMLGKGTYVQSGFGNPVFNQTPYMDTSPEEGDYKRWPSYDSEDCAFRNELQSRDDSKLTIEHSTSMDINRSNKDRIVQFFKRM